LFCFSILHSSSFAHKFSLAQLASIFILPQRRATTFRVSLQNKAPDNLNPLPEPRVEPNPWEFQQAARNDNPREQTRRGKTFLLV
jgi:hypothetical protein